MVRAEPIHRAWVWALVVGTFAWAGAMPTAADDTKVMDGKLSDETYGAAAAWTGDAVYLFGGCCSTYDRIVRYDPLTDATQTMAAKLDPPRYSASAVWDGTHVYVFGGRGDGQWRDEIYQYDPAMDSGVVLPDKLPSGRAWTSAVWDGTYAYIFGGRSSVVLDEILRFDPSTGDVDTLPTSLLNPTHVSSAVWNGTHAFIFGGNRDDFTAAADDLYGIQRFDPATGDVEMMTAELHVPKGHAAVWTGTRAFLFGGAWGTSNRFEIQCYDPQQDARRNMASQVGMGSWAFGAAWNGTHAFIAGGVVNGGGGPLPHYSDEIVRYSPAPDAPSATSATPGPGKGEITVSWTVPPSDSHCDDLSQVLYRTDDEGDPVVKVGTLDASTSTHTVTGLGNGATHHFRVVAESPNGASMGGLATATTFDVPRAPRSASIATDPATKKITVAWDAPSGDGGTPIFQYHVYRRVMVTSAPTLIASVPFGVESVVDDGCQLFQVCTYWVTAENLVGEGPNSNTLHTVGLRGLDDDNDGVPDDREGTICGQENPFIEEDGTCTPGDDYHPPWAPEG